MSSNSGASPPEPDSRRSHDARGRGRSVAKAVLAIPMAIVMPFVIVFRALKQIWGDPQNRSILTVAVWLLAAGTVIYMFLEDLSPIDAFYFSFITLATIGYGDITPTSELSRLVTVIYSIVGLGILAALISAIGAQRLAISSRRRAKYDEHREDG